MRNYAWSCETFLATPLLAAGIRSARLLSARDFYPCPEAGTYKEPSSDCSILEKVEYLRGAALDRELGFDFPPSSQSQPLPQLGGGQEPFQRVCQLHRTAGRNQQAI